MSNRSNSVTEQVLEGAVLNNTIQVGTNTTNIGNNATAIGVNAGDITTNSTNIGNNATAIGVNAGDITTNTTNIGNNATAIGVNAGDITTNTTNIGNNATAIGVNAGDITTNTTNIGNNATAIGVNAGDITTNTTNIGNNATAIGVNAGDITTLEANSVPKSANWNYVTGYGIPASGTFQLAGALWSTSTQVRISKTDLAGNDQSDLILYLLDEQVTTNFIKYDKTVSKSFTCSNISDLISYWQFDKVFTDYHSYGNDTPETGVDYCLDPLASALHQALGYYFSENITVTPASVGVWFQVANPSTSSLGSLYSNGPYWTVTEPNTGPDQTPTFTYSGPFTRVWQVSVTFDVENANPGAADLSFRSTVNGVANGLVRRQTMRANQFQIISGLSFVPFTVGDILRFEIRNDSNNDTPLVTNLTVSLLLID